MTAPATLSLVLHRARAFPAPVVSVALNVLVVCTLVSGLAASLALLQQDALAQTMAAEPPDRTVVALSAPYDDEDPARQDELVDQALRPVTEVAGGDVVRLVETGSYDLAGARADGQSDGWVVTAVSGDVGRLRAGSGRLPAAGTSGPIEIAAPRGSGLEPGQHVTLVGRADERRVPAVVTGTWLVQQDAGRWLSDLDPAALVAPTDRIGELAGSGSRVRWRAVPSLDDLAADQLPTLAAAEAGVATEAEAAGAELATTVALESDLGTVLAERASELTVLRALLLVPAGLLVLVAAAGLVLVAAGLAGVRREEEGLFRSRGANQRQLVGPTVVETLLICGLAAVAAPPLATLLIRIGDVRPPLSWPAWFGSVVAAAVCALALSIPVVTRALSGDRGLQEGVERQRRRALTGLVALGLFVAGTGALAAATLSRFGDAVGRATIDSRGVDPLLVASPALLLLAVAVLASLVALPPLFRLVSAGLARRGVAPALGSRFAARAPRVSVPLALTVALASGVLAFAAVERDSSTTAREVRADHVAGSDVRVITPPSAQRAGVAEERRLLRGTDGVDRVTPVFRAESFLDDLPAEVLMTEVSAATAPDLLGPAAGGWQDLADPAWADESNGVALPAGSSRLTVSVTGGGSGASDLWLAGPDGTVTVVPTRIRSGDLSAELPARLPSGSRLLAVRTGRGGAGPPDVSVTVDGERLQTQARWFSPDRIVHVTFGPEELPVPTTVPVVLTERLARDASLSVGDTVAMPVLGIPSQVEVVATVPELRTVVGSAGGVLIDTATALPALLPNGFTEDPGEWWLDTGGRPAAAVASDLAARPDVAADVVSREEVLAQLDADPSTGGTALGRVLLLTGGGCLVVGVLLLFSVVLLRRPEHAEQARRIGAAGGDRRDLVGVLSWEYAVTTGAGLATGVVAGGLVASVTLVSMTLGPDGEVLVPEPELVVPWLPVLLAPLTMVTVPLLAMVWLTRRRHRPGLGALDRARSGR